MKKYLFIIGACIMFFYGIKNYIPNQNVLLYENIEALTNEETGSNLWFSNLRTVSCPIIRVNYIGGFVFEGVPIPIGNSYTYYGSKSRCERELTTNSCYLSQETPCS